MRVTEERVLRGIVLDCGTNLPLQAGLADGRVSRVPARPGKADVDELLGAAADLGEGPGAAVIVAGTDADLAAVVLRVLRKDLLGSVGVGFVPSSPDSMAAALWAIPTDPVRALDLAATGPARPVPLIRDDKGGVLVGQATVGRVQGEAYCDDTHAFRGVARAIAVTPDVRKGAVGVAATVTTGRVFPRRASYAGRAFQLGCEPAVAVIDGVRQPREAPRWTWYRHTEDLLLVHGHA